MGFSIAMRNLQAVGAEEISNGRDMLSSMIASLMVKGHKHKLVFEIVRKHFAEVFQFTTKVTL